MTERSSQGGYYIIRVRERLDESWSEWFDPLTLSWDGRETVIMGPVEDQTALHGVIGRLQRLGLFLISINRMDGPPPIAEQPSAIASSFESSRESATAGDPTEMVSLVDHSAPRNNGAAGRANE